MYGKILHGASFGGLINYINDPRKNAILVTSSDGVNAILHQARLKIKEKEDEQENQS